MLNLKSLIKRCVYGLVCGILLAVGVFFIKAICNDMGGTIKESLFVTQILICGIMGMGFVGISQILSIENLSVLSKVIIHAIVQAIFYFTLAYIAGWIPSNKSDILIMISIYIITYVVFWISYKHYWKKKIEEINLSLSNRRM